MIQVIDSSNVHAASSVVRSFSALRYEIFIKRLGWTIPVATDGLEIDQFDDDNAIYLVCTNRDGDAVGGARLLDTSRRSLLAELFPHLVMGPIPVGPRIFEVTRFAVDPRRERTAGCGDVCAELLWALQEYAAHAQLKHLVSVSYLSMEPILRRAGYRFHRIGPTLELDGTKVVALQHAVSPDVLEYSRRRAAVSHPIALVLPGTDSQPVVQHERSHRLASLAFPPSDLS